MEGGEAVPSVHDPPPEVRGMRLVGFSPHGHQGKAGKHISQASAAASVLFLSEPSGEW